MAGHPRRQRHRLADRPARGGGGRSTHRRRRVEQPRGRLLGAARRRVAPARRRCTPAGLVLRLEQGGRREPGPALPREVRPDRGEPADRLVLAAPVRPARCGDLALPRRRRKAGRGGPRADGHRLPHRLGVSANTTSWWSRAGGEAIGYRPQDDSEAYASELAESDDGQPAALGGEFISNPLGQPL